MELYSPSTGWAVYAAGMWLPWTDTPPPTHLGRVQCRFEWDYMTFELAVGPLFARPNNTDRLLWQVPGEAGSPYSADQAAANPLI